MACEKKHLDIYTFMFYYSIETWRLQKDFEKSFPQPGSARNHLLERANPQSFPQENQEIWHDFFVHSILEAQKILTGLNTNRYTMEGGETMEQIGLIAHVLEDGSCHFHPFFILPGGTIYTDVWTVVPFETTYGAIS